MKRTFSFLLLLALCIPMMVAHEVVAPVNVFGRQVTSLNGQWKYIVDQQEMV